MSAQTRILRAFTLIEVLIGVLILALGLLGLGAIIPVVIREQRIAVMQTLGNEAANAAKKYLLGRPDLDPSTPFDFTADPQGRLTARETIGWDVWLMDTQNWSPEVPVGQAPRAMSYLWMPRRTSGARQEFVLSNSVGSMPAWANTAGDFGWHITRANPLPPLDMTISLADRLWPSESMQGEAYLRPGLDPHRPQFVWDFIGRRVQTKPSEPRQLQIAIFVRQVDQNIRIPRGNHAGGPAGGTPITLRDVLLDRLPGSPNSKDARVPTCAYPPGGPQGYLPTNAGALPGTPAVLNYAEPISVGDQASGVTIVFRPDVSATWLEFQGFLGAGDNRWSLLSQGGQKLLDNLGNVYTVRGTLENLEPGTYQQQYAGRQVVVIDPPVPSYIPDTGDTGPSGVPVLRQIVFTPQVPSAVEVFNITRAVP